MASKIDPFVDQLGKVPDAEIATLSGLTESKVASLRQKLEIPAFDPDAAPSGPEPAAPAEASPAPIGVKPPGHPDDMVVPIPIDFNDQAVQAIMEPLDRMARRIMEQAAALEALAARLEKLERLIASQAKQLPVVPNSDHGAPPRALQLLRAISWLVKGPNGRPVARRFGRSIYRNEMAALIWQECPADQRSAISILEK